MGDREELAELRRLAELEAKTSASRPAIDPSEGGLPFRPLGIETGLTMPQGVSRFMAGIGKAPYDVGRTARQVFSSDPSVQREIDDAKSLDAPLMKTGAGMAGNIAGNAAMFAPTALIPGANTYTGAALLGSLMGAAQPTATGESRLANALAGSVAGMGGQAVGNLVGRTLRPIASRLGPEEQALAEAAAKEGIPLTAGQKTGSRPLQIAESVMENLPLTSGSQLAGREAQQRAFTAAALKRAGITGDSAQAGTLLTQKNALGKEIGDVAERGSLDFNRGLTDKLASIVDDAAKRLPPDSARKVSGSVDQILSQVEQNGAMLGTNYQGWREPLRALASEGGATGRIYQDIRKVLDAEFRGQLSGADRAAVEEASRKYANVKTIIDAMGGAGSLPAKGQVAPAQLSAALSRAMGREGKALGRGDLNELSRVGQVFVRDQIPNSGTAQRQLAQALLTGGGGATVGGGAALAMGKDPIEGMAIGAGIGGAGLLTPKLIQTLMNSKAGQSYLSEGAINLTPSARKMLSDALRTGAIGSVPALEAQ